MKHKMWYVISFGFVAVMVLYFVMNPSYQKSIEARVYFTMGDYEDAYLLASEAFRENEYNRMASTVMAQSKTALVFVNYIKEAKQYMKAISAIAQDDNSTGITQEERAKMKLMSEIMIEQYIKIAPSVITDQALVDEARHYYDEFKALHENLTK